MIKFLLIMAAMSVLLFTVIIACDDTPSVYACWGGFSDHCWEADSEDYADNCAAQDRTFSTGTCPDNGYPKDCGDYWVKSGVACW